CRAANLGLDNHRTRAQHVDVALVELAKSSSRRPIRAPHGLYLITLEKLRQLVAILCNDACERHRQVVTQSEISFATSLMNAALQYLEDKLITLVTILPHQRFNVFRRRCLQRLKTVAL